MSSPYSHIACCVEQSAASEQTLLHARRIRELGPGRLTLLHVLNEPIPYPTIPLSGWIPQFPEMPAEAEAWIANMLAPGEEYVLLDGEPASATCDWAAANGCDLLVAAAHRGVVERILLGSFAGYLSHHSPCPVLLVRPIQKAEAAA